VVRSIGQYNGLWLNPGSCKSSVTVFQAGCEAAKERLSSVDVLRKSEPDYKLGWNAFGK
jgi:hypothetical protein